MRKTLRRGSAALAASAALAISLSALNTGTRMTGASPPGPSGGLALAPAANSESEGPASADSCANGGWRMYSRPKFQNQNSCELWARKHAAPGPAVQKPPAEKKSGSSETRTTVPFLA